MKRWKVLISHSSKHADQAGSLKKHLELVQSLKVFLSKEDLKLGDSWELRLLEALRDMEVMICLVSKEWLKSGWCNRELEEARSRRVLVVPVCVGNCETGDRAIDTYQWVQPKDRIHKDDKDWHEVTKALVLRLRAYAPPELPRPAPSTIYRKARTRVRTVSPSRRTS